MPSLAEIQAQIAEQAWKAAELQELLLAAQKEEVEHIWKAAEKKERQEKEAEEKRLAEVARLAEVTLKAEEDRKKTRRGTTLYRTLPFPEHYSLPTGSDSSNSLYP